MRADSIHKPSIAESIGNALWTAAKAVLYALTGLALLILSIAIVGLVVAAIVGVGLKTYFFTQSFFGFFGAAATVAAEISSISTGLLLFILFLSPIIPLPLWNIRKLGRWYFKTFKNQLFPNDEEDIGDEASPKSEAKEQIHLDSCLSFMGKTVVSDQKVKTDFFNGVFLLLGHLAKTYPKPNNIADQINTPDKNQFKLDKNQFKKEIEAFNAFNNAKSSADTIDLFLTTNAFYRASLSQPLLLKQFLGKIKENKTLTDYFKGIIIDHWLQTKMKIFSKNKEEAKTSFVAQHQLFEELFLGAGAVVAHDNEEAKKIRNGLKQQLDPIIYDLAIGYFDKGTKLENKPLNDARTNFKKQCLLHPTLITNFLPVQDHATPEVVDATFEELPWWKKPGWQVVTLVVIIISTILGLAFIGFGGYLGTLSFSILSNTPKLAQLLGVIFGSSMVVAFGGYAANATPPLLNDFWLGNHLEPHPAEMLQKPSLPTFRKNHEINWRGFKDYAGDFFNWYVQKSYKTVALLATIGSTFFLAYPALTFFVPLIITGAITGPLLVIICVAAFLCLLGLFIYNMVNTWAKIRKDGREHIAEKQKSFLACANAVDRILLKFTDNDKRIIVADLKNPHSEENKELFDQRKANIYTRGRIVAYCLYGFGSIIKGSGTAIGVWGVNLLLHAGLIAIFAGATFAAAPALLTILSVVLTVVALCLIVFFTIASIVEFLRYYGPYGVNTLTGNMWEGYDDKKEIKALPPAPANNEHVSIASARVGVFSAPRQCDDEEALNQPFDSGTSVIAVSAGGGK